MTSTLNGGNPITILNIEENGHIGDLWENAQKLCELYFNRQMNTIGNEMKEA